MPRSPNGGGADFDHLRRVSRSMHQDEDEAEGNELPNIPASATRAPGKTRMSKRERKQSNQRTTVPPILMSAPLPVSSPLYSAETSPVAISPKPLYDNKSTTQQFLDEDEEDGEFQGGFGFGDLDEEDQSPKQEIPYPGHRTTGGRESPEVESDFGFAATHLQPGRISLHHDERAAPKSPVAAPTFHSALGEAGADGPNTNNAVTEFQIGDRVHVDGFKPPGTVKFVGISAETNKPRVGIELDRPEGRMDGSQKGVVYFTCDKKDGHYGVLAAPKLVHLMQRSGQNLPRADSVASAKSHKYVNPVVSLGKFASEVAYVNESAAPQNKTRRTSYAEVDKKVKNQKQPKANANASKPRKSSLPDEAAVPPVPISARPNAVGGQRSQSETVVYNPSVDTIKDSTNHDAREMYSSVKGAEDEAGSSPVTTTTYGKVQAFSKDEILEMRRRSSMKRHAVFTKASSNAPSPEAASLQSELGFFKERDAVDLDAQAEKIYGQKASGLGLKGAVADKFATSPYTRTAKFEEHHTACQQQRDELQATWDMILHLQPNSLKEAQRDKSKFLQIKASLPKKKKSVDMLLHAAKEMSKDGGWEVQDDSVDKCHVLDTARKRLEAFAASAENVINDHEMREKFKLSAMKNVGNVEKKIEFVENWLHEVSAFPMEDVRDCSSKAHVDSAIAKRKKILKTVDPMRQELDVIDKLLESIRRNVYLSEHSYWQYPALGDLLDQHVGCQERLDELEKMVEECIVELQHALVVAEHSIERDPQAHEADRALVKAGKEHTAVIARFRGVSVWALKTKEVVQLLREPSASQTGAQRAVDIYRSIMTDFQHQFDFITGTTLPDTGTSKGAHANMVKAQRDAKKDTTALKTALEDLHVFVEDQKKKFEYVKKVDELVQQYVATRRLCEKWCHTVEVFVKKPHPVGMSSLGAVLVAECDQLISEADERRTTLDGLRAMRKDITAARYESDTLAWMYTETSRLNADGQKLTDDVQSAYCDLLEKRGELDDLRRAALQAEHLLVAKERVLREPSAEANRVYKFKKIEEWALRNANSLDTVVKSVNSAKAQCAKYFALSKDLRRHKDEIEKLRRSGKKHQQTPALKRAEQTMISAMNGVQTHVLQKKNVVEDDLQRELVVSEVQEKAKQFHVDRQKLDDWVTECRRYLVQPMKTGTLRDIQKAEQTLSSWEKQHATQKTYLEDLQRTLDMVESSSYSSKHSRYSYEGMAQLRYDNERLANEMENFADWFSKMRNTLSRRFECLPRDHSM
eukprot:m.1605466 g.1605466  ORF g.1605466 m.1605466 type:complete len:1262 (+) comp25358_c0_seq55:189-3974(+)